jgi:hypothetical protein
MLCRLLEASSLIDDVFASALAGRIEPEAAVILADAALASPAADTGAHALQQPVSVDLTLNYADKPRAFQCDGVAGGFTHLVQGFVGQGRAARR